jgi:hypothetical protein
MDIQVQPAKYRILKKKPPSVGVMSAERLELSTNGLKGHCSTIELRARGSAGCPGGLHSIMQGG